MWTRKAWVGVGLLLGCGGSSPSPTEPSPTVGGGEGHYPIQNLQAAPVYDADGEEQSCAEPQENCPPIAPDRDFIDQCNLAGFRVQTCGCASMCTGKVNLGMFDEGGQRKPCAPSKDGCVPPNASTAFQDACAERGYRLVSCGCEAWLCSGDPTK